MAEFTKGPWQFDTVKTSVGRCFRIGNADMLAEPKRTKLSYGCIYLYDDYGHGENEAKANAALIAAAPDLYEALRTIVAITMSGHAELHNNEAIRHAARSALSKADGKGET